ncbi:SET domain-containing protein 4 isoform X1 [Bufo bufo]|uniref:SET domain-containing protein 4 isoform X1 n=3 Tax=Bufo bufo TaxID=8384 RepID=UPI001ABE3977|nr:SET domain-containing protein 4 isoform X1 [Bufo bufo]XP_040279060.1 SET domain-containing protein 4 isoform X1 [Bufo bufo]XP_040279061.1 SET domain-containing protein 4 isoform X1 [Bufo bufo]
MSPKRGRTGRRRRRGPETSTVNQSHARPYIQLMRWMKERGFRDKRLRTAHFPDTGRGLMTTQLLQPGELIISLPESCLLTTSTVLTSYLGKYIHGWRPPVSPLLALCTFLVLERYVGDQSPWKPYLDVLPSAYDCPVYWEEETVNYLPDPVRQKAAEQRSAIQEFYSSALPFFKSLSPLFPEAPENILSYEAVRWAWCTVNTRTVYMKHAHRECFSAEQDVYALAPYLDLLNHNAGVQVEASFNEKNRCYEIRTKVPYKKYEQVFICYSHHDNQRLLLEYGFIAAHNPHQSVYVARDAILQFVSRKDKQLQKKWSLLKENGFLENLTFGPDGPSWRLLTACRLLCLGADEFTSWKKILLGSFVSESCERASVELVRKICLHLLEQTSRALDEISSRKSEKTADPHLVLVEALRQEEMKILTSSADILQNGDTTTI